MISRLTFTGVEYSDFRFYIRKEINFYALEKQIFLSILTNLKQKRKSFFVILVKPKHENIGLGVVIVTGIPRI